MLPSKKKILLWISCQTFLEIRKCKEKKYFYEYLVKLFLRSVCYLQRKKNTFMNILSTFLEIRMLPSKKKYFYEYLFRLKTKNTVRIKTNMLISCCMYEGQSISWNIAFTDRCTRNIFFTWESMWFYSMDWFFESRSCGKFMFSPFIKLFWLKYASLYTSHILL